MILPYGNLWVGSPCFKLVGGKKQDLQRQGFCVVFSTKLKLESRNLTENCREIHVCTWRGECRWGVSIRKIGKEFHLVSSSNWVLPIEFRCVLRKIIDLVWVYPQVITTVNKIACRENRVIFFFFYFFFFLGEWVW